MNVLTFFAHPDDETMLAGGTLALLAMHGAQVNYLSATRGEGGETGNPPLCSQEELGEVREKELVCAVQALSGTSLTFLGYQDPLVGEGEALFAYSDNLTVLAGQVALSIKQFQADVVITHGSNGEYGHPAHQLTHQAARIAVESFGENAPVLYSVQAAYPDHPRPRLANKDDPANLVIDIRAGIERKVAAALCHRTQHDLFQRKNSEEAGHPVTVEQAVERVHFESLHRVFALPAGKVDQLVELLEKTTAVQRL